MMIHTRNLTSICQVDLSLSACDPKKKIKKKLKHKIKQRNQQTCTVLPKEPAAPKQQGNSSNDSNNNKKLQQGQRQQQLENVLFVFSVFVSFFCSPFGVSVFLFLVHTGHIYKAHFSPSFAWFELRMYVTKLDHG